MNSNINKKVKHINLGHIDYQKAWNKEELFAEILSVKSSNRKENKTVATKNHLIFCEHPHVYTLGKSVNEKNLLISASCIKAKNATYYKINRGGDITYHGPGQL